MQIATQRKATLKLSEVGWIRDTTCFAAGTVFFFVLLLNSMTLSNDG